MRNRQDLTKSVYALNDDNLTQNQQSAASVANPGPARDLERFSYICRIISGKDDDFIRRAGIGRLERMRFRQRRWRVYRRSVAALRRYCACLERAALAGVAERRVEFEQVFLARMSVRLAVTRLQTAGVLYAIGAFGESGFAVRAGVQSLSEALATFTSPVPDAA